MNKNIHNAIKKEYERKQKAAFDRLSFRREEVYAKVPGIEDIEQQIQLSGVRYNKMILLGTNPVDEVFSRLLIEIDELRRRKEKLLIQAGYPSDYLEVAYECTHCKDTGFIGTGSGAVKCSCYKQQLINELYHQSNLQLTKTENFAAFNDHFYPDVVNESKYTIKMSPRENVLRIKERCLRFIENFSSPDEKNLFFSGPTGVGKTFMTNCIAAELLSKGITVLYQTAPMLFNIINEYKMNAYKDDEYQDSTYRDILDVELLIIDDLGTESQSAARYADFLTILNTRQINNLSRPCKTIISTNIGIKELYEYYDERNASRIIGYFDMFRFAGEDIRSIKKLGTR